MPNYPLSQINLTNESFPNGVTLVIKDAEAREALAGKVAYAAYDSTNKVIVFYNTADSPTSSDILCYIDARDFIKDGMVDSVVVEDGNLIITFNTDSGKEPISIPLTDIFDPDLYYTKSETDSKLERKANEDGYYSRMVVGGAETLIGDVPQTATYTFRRTGGGAIGQPVARLTEIQGNTGVVNQLVTNAYKSGSNAYVDTRENERADIYFFYKSSSYLSLGYYVTAVGRKGAIISVPSDAERFNVKRNGGTRNFELLPNQTALVTSTAGHKVYISINYTGIDYATVGGYTWDDVQVFDLTLMYGAGYEPATVAEFEQRIWRDYGKTLDEYIAYTQGKLVNCKALALESTGQNQWDEEWELGMINTSTGAPQTSTSNIRSKNYISISPSTQYYFKKPAGKIVYVYYYSASQDYLGYRDPFSTAGTGGTFTTIAGAVYMKFVCGIATYNHDICINISDAAVNGTYRPYQKDVVNLNLATLTGINPTTGVRETVFPNGLGGGDGWRSALRVVNGATVAVKNSERVDLGILTYTLDTGLVGVDRYKASITNIKNFQASEFPNVLTPLYPTLGMSAANSAVSKNAVSSYSKQIWFFTPQGKYADGTAFKAAVNGVYLEYQLATPIVYTDLQYADGTPFVLPKNYAVQNDGTEKITHAEGEDSIAPVMSAIYGLNAVGTIQGMPKDYTSQATLDGLIAKISAITGTTITKTWDAANNKWIFS